MCWAMSQYQDTPRALLTVYQRPVFMRMARLLRLKYVEIRHLQKSDFQCCILKNNWKACVVVHHNGFIFCHDAVIGVLSLFHM